jgi:hypothetical protein
MLILHSEKFTSKYKENGVILNRKVLFVAAKSLVDGVIRICWHNIELPH